MPLATPERNELAVQTKRMSAGFRNFSDPPDVPERDPGHNLSLRKRGTRLLTSIPSLSTDASLQNGAYDEIVGDYERLKVAVKREQETSGRLSKQLHDAQARIQQLVGDLRAESAALRTAERKVQHLRAELAEAVGGGARSGNGESSPLRHMAASQCSLEAQHSDMGQTISRCSNAPGHRSSSRGDGSTIILTVIPNHEKGTDDECSEIPGGFSYVDERDEFASVPVSTFRPSNTQRNRHSAIIGDNMLSPLLLQPSEEGIHVNLDEASDAVSASSESSRRSDVDSEPHTPLREGFSGPTSGTHFSHTRGPTVLVSTTQKPITAASPSVKAMSCHVPIHRTFDNPLGVPSQPYIVRKFKPNALMGRSSVSAYQA